MQTPEAIKNILVQNGVFRRGHFILSSPRPGTSLRQHSDTYINLKAGLKLEDLREVCTNLAELVREHRPDGIVVAAYGGIASGHLTAQLYGPNFPCFFATRRHSGDLALRRGFEKRLEGKRVLVVDHEMGNLRSQELVDLVRRNGGIPVGFAGLCSAISGSAEGNPPRGMPYLVQSPTGKIDWTSSKSVAAQALGIVEYFITIIKFDVVVGYNEEGIMLSLQIAQLALAKNPDVVSMFAEQECEGGLTIPDAFASRVKRKNLVVLEDVVTTGKTSVAAADLVGAHGGNVVGCVAICIRGPATAESLGFRSLRALLEVRSITTWAPPLDVCPLCEEGIPVDETVGHGTEYMAELRKSQASAASP